MEVAFEVEEQRGGDRYRVEGPRGGCSRFLTRPCVPGFLERGLQGPPQSPRGCRAVRHLPRGTIGADSRVRDSQGTSALEQALCGGWIRGGLLRPSGASCVLRASWELLLGLTPPITLAVFL